MAILDSCKIDLFRQGTGFHILKSELDNHLVKLTDGLRPARESARNDRGLDLGVTVNAHGEGRMSQSNRDVPPLSPNRSRFFHRGIELILFRLFGEPAFDADLLLDLNVSLPSDCYLRKLGAREPPIEEESKEARGPWPVAHGS